MPSRRPLRFSSLFTTSLLPLLLLAACDGATDGSGGAGGTGGTAPVCNPGAKWAPGAQAFQDATAKWGLDALAVQGVRLNAVDFDGDGWTDLYVRRGGNGTDDFAAGGARQTWLLRNDQKGGFEDVTQKSGIAQLRQAPDPNKGRPSEVVAFGDVDNDGDLDVLTGFTNNADPKSPETTELLLNNGDGTFALGPAENPFRVEAPKTDTVAGVTFVDYDRDGNLDVWIVQNVVNSPVQDRLYRGDGAGHFTDVTQALGLKTKSWINTDDLNEARGHSIGWSSNACDLNNDGNPELLASSYGRAPDHLWQSGGPGAGFVFTNRSVESGYAFDHRVDWTDNESARCWCKLHPDAEDCEGVPEPMYIACTAAIEPMLRWDHTVDREPFRLGGNSGATECIDIDNDGDIDLLTGEIVHWDVGTSSDPSELLLNTGEPDVRFERPGNDVTGLARQHVLPDWNEGLMTGSLFDFDNDGWADVYLGDSDYPGTHGLLFHQDGPAHFQPVPIELGIDHHRSHGSVVADFDNDGDLDIVVGHSRARCDANLPDDCYPTAQVRFFENVLGQTGHFLQLSLTGAPGANRLAIGARVTVKTAATTQIRDVEGGHGHYGSQDDLTVHFGLGDACTADVTVRWPDGALTTQTFTLDADRRYTLTQGQDPKPAEQ